MRSTMMREVCTDKADHRRLRVTCTREHVTRAPEHAPLEEQAEATILAVFAAVICASLSVGCVIGIGLCKALGVR